MDLVSGVCVTCDMSCGHEDVIEALRELTASQRRGGLRHLFCPICNNIVSPKNEEGGQEHDSAVVRIYCWKDCAGFRARRLLEKTR